MIMAVLNVFATSSMAGFICQDNDATITVTAWYEWGAPEPSGVFEIPATINGKPVTAIADPAFDNSKNIMRHECL